MVRKENLLISDREQHEIINAQVRQLHRISNAFSMTGNDTIAFELEKMADKIAEASATLSGNASERINIDFKESQESSGRILEAALGAISINARQNAIPSPPQEGE